MPTAANLAYTRLTPADVCGRRALAAEGGDLGEVGDLIVDPDRRAAYLWVAPDAGACLVVPVERVAEVTGAAVRLDVPAGDAVAALAYDPCVPEAQFLDRVAAALGRRPGLAA